MNYGCIGERLTHSFSKEIHGALADYQYELKELSPDELSDFMDARNFKAINVTIPYKEKVIPHLYYIDEHARLIGAVNTVVNRGGKLYGYNTDFFGMTRLLERAGVTVEGKKVVILGSGGTSKTALAVVKALGASCIIRVSRTAKEDSVDYECLYREHNDAEVIINTTPVGMYPHGDGLSVDISKFKRLTGVIDAIYNPLRTRLVIEAKKRGIPAEGGLYMLVAQAVRASEIFIDKDYPQWQIDKTYDKILKEKENITLIGMPASGKSTVGRLLSRMTERSFLDTDTLIEDASKMSIPQIFREQGESEFRRIESEIVNKCSQYNSKILATGGGVVLNEANIDALRQNGRIYFIDRPLDMLIPTSDRPLSADRAAIEKRYAERYELYLRSCDTRIDGEPEAGEVAKTILGDFTK